MIVLVTGGRDYSDVRTLQAELTRINKATPFTLLIHGCAQGADMHAANWALSRGIHPVGVPALWDFYSKQAGPIRNRAMLWLKPELVIAFPGGNGTANMVGQARQAGIKVIDISNQDLVS